MLSKEEIKAIKLNCQNYSNEITWGVKPPIDELSLHAKIMIYIVPELIKHIEEIGKYSENDINKNIELLRHQ